MKKNTVINLYIIKSLVLICLIHRTTAQTCTSPDITEDQFNFGYINSAIEPKYVGTVIEFNMVDTTDVTLNDNYINAAYANNKLTISTKEEFRDYEKTNTNPDNLQLTVSLTFRCAGGGSRSLLFSQNIVQKNNYPPEFAASEYEFELPLPLPQNFNITLFQEIITTDYDLGTNSVTYSITGTSLFTANANKVDYRTFNAILKTNQPLLRLREPLEFTLTATDNGAGGDPPRSSQTKIRIKADETLQNADPPHFEKVLYTGSLTLDQELTIENVVLVQETYNNGILFELAGADKEYFQIQQNTNTITITLSKPVPENVIANSNFLSVTLEALSDIALPGQTAIIIELPKVNVELPVFAKSFYSGKLDRGQSLTLEDVVLQAGSYDDTIAFSLEGADMQYFEITHQSNIVKLQVKEIPADVLLAKSFFSVSVKADRAEGGAAAVAIIIENENHQTFLKFENSLYSGTVTETSVLTLSEIIITTFSPGVAVELVGEHKDWFVSTLTNNVVAIRLGAPIPEVSLNGLDNIVLSLVASKSGLASATTVIIISITRAIVVEPEFEMLTYTGTLTEAGALQLPTLTLSQATYTSDVQFTLQDPSNLFQITNVLNVVTVSLQGGVTDEDLRDKNSLVLSINAAKPKANRVAHAVVVLNIIKSVANSPRFEKSLYTGQITETNELSIEVIRLVPETNGVDVQLQLIGDDSALFTYENANGVITLKLGNPLEDDDLRDKTLFKFVLQANRPGAPVAQTAIVLDIPTAGLKILQFEKPLYRGSIHPDTELSMVENVVLSSATWDSAVTFSIQNDPTGVFRISNENNVVSVELVRSLTPEEFDNWRSLSFNVEAVREGALTSITTVTIEVLSKVLQIPTYEKRMYRGSFSNDLSLSLEKLIITPSTYSPDIKLSLSGGFDLFKFTNENGEITIEVKQPLTEQDLEGRSYFQLEMLAERSEAEQSTAGILIDVPLKECDLPPIDQPYFEYANYHLVIKTDITGPIGVMKATVDDPTGRLLYSLDISNPYLANKIQIDGQRGRLILIDFLVPDAYPFVVKVTNTVNGKSAITNVLLTVETEKKCPGEKVTTVAKSLMIEYLAENSDHDIMSIQIDDCEYEILYVEPNDRDYFTIDQTQKRLVATAFDREDMMFQGYAVPQFQIKLKLKCPDPDKFIMPTEHTEFNFTNKVLPSVEQRLSPVDPFGKYFVLTKEVFFANDVTTLNVIIKDMNDNTPRFTSPKSPTVFVLGYPEPEVAEKILPAYLYKVEAEDIDEGENAAIRFSINPNNHFDINPNTGVIYPLKNAMTDSNTVAIEVQASDLNGKPGALSATQELSVKRLELKHLSVVTIADEKSENIEVIIEYIKNSLNLDIRVLSQAMISIKQTTAQRMRSLMRKLRIMRAEGDTTVLRLITYALDDQNELHDADYIEKKLANLGETYQISFMPVDDFACIGGANPTSDCSKSGLIVGISILGGLMLLLCIAGCVALYFYWLRPYLKERSQKESSLTSSEANLANDFLTTPPNSSPIQDIQKRSSMLIEGTTLQESESDNVTKLSKKLGSMLEEHEESSSNFEDSSSESHDSVVVDMLGSPKDKGKSIKFNEVVERIEVVEEVAEDDETDVEIKL